MRVTATTDVVRIMGTWARRADAGLARSAARNAAHSMDDARVREIDDARTLRDLRDLAGVARVEPPTTEPKRAAQN